MESRRLSRKLNMACQRLTSRSPCRMRIYQGELYQKGEKFIRIRRVDRYEVEFKSMEGDAKADGPVAVLPKKEFCRLIRGMKVVAPGIGDLPTGSAVE